MLGDVNLLSESVRPITQDLPQVLIECFKLAWPTMLIYVVEHSASVKQLFG